MKKSKMRKGVKKAVPQIGNSQSSIELLKLSKPAQRALLNNGIRTIADLSKWTLEEIKGFHGIGPSAFPVLKQAIRQNGLAFKKS